MSLALREAFTRILSELPIARSKPFAGNSLARFIRDETAAEVQNNLGAVGMGMHAHGSAGAGQWAAVPWIAVFDDLVTDSATRGYYLVYLFHTSEPMVHLSLNQGTTATRAEFKGRTREVLRDRAALMRRRLQDFQLRLSVLTMNLGSDALLPGDYVAGHALGVSYDLGDMPSELVLRDDLLTAVAAYRALTFRGGLDVTFESEITASGATLLEDRRYRFHRRIERNSKAAQEAKRVHGIRCQACSMSFGERYGHVREGYIEAHHLRPISSLEEGVPVPYDVKTDFAVLCSNCHRMIHRTENPSDLNAFRQSLGEPT